MPQHHRDLEVGEEYLARHLCRVPCLPASHRTESCSYPPVPNAWLCACQYLHIARLTSRLRPARVECVNGPLSLGSRCQGFSWGRPIIRWDTLQTVDRHYQIGSRLRPETRWTPPGNVDDVPWRRQLERRDGWRLGWPNVVAILGQPGTLRACLGSNSGTFPLS